MNLPNTQKILQIWYRFLSKKLQICQNLLNFFLNLVPHTIEKSILRFKLVRNSHLLLHKIFGISQSAKPIVLAIYQITLCKSCWSQQIIAHIVYCEGKNTKCYKPTWLFLSSMHTIDWCHKCNSKTLITTLKTKNKNKKNKIFVLQLYLNVSIICQIRKNK